MPLDGLETKGDLKRFIEQLLENPGVLNVQGVSGLVDQLTAITGDISDLSEIVPEDVQAGDGLNIDTGTDPRTIEVEFGTGHTQVRHGDDAAYSDSRSPTAHHASHEPGGSDPMTVDAAAAVGSLRTLGTGAAQAAVGNHGHAQADITGLIAALAAKQALSEKGAANGYAGLDAGGKISSAALPAIAITSTSVVASQAAQLALTAQEGDVAVRSDESKAYIHNGGTAGTMADWTLLATPVDVVLSVNGKVGAVTLDVADFAGISTFMRTVLDDTTASAVRTTLGLIIGTDVAAQGDSRFPTSGEKSALAGTDGTPGSGNKYVTDSDDRLTALNLTLPDALLTFRPAFYLTLGASGGLTDQGSGGHNGTAVGGLSAGGGASLTSDGGASTDFDGTDDRITTGYNPFTIGSTLTICLWMQRDTTVGTDTLIASDSATHYPNISIDTTAFLDAHMDGGASGGAMGPMPLASIPLFVVAVIKPASTTLYVNGQQLGIAFAGGSNSFNASPGNFQIGSRGTTTNPYDGKMSHVAVFEKELTPGSIGWLYAIGAGRFAKDWGFVTSLPTAPLYGDRVTYIADSTNGVYWNLIYDGTGSYPWKVLGGPPLFAEVATDETRGTASYGALATAGPSITVPLAGDYDVEVGCYGYNNSAGSGVHMSYDIGATGAVDADSYEWSVAAATSDSQMGKAERRKTGLTASAALVSKYKPTAGTAHFKKRRMRVMPVRVG